MCMNCSVVFLNPRMSDLDEYYEEGVFDHDFRLGPTKEAIERTFVKMKAVWEGVREYLPEEGTLLDIGCGMGAFIHHASKQFRVIGLEPSPVYREWAHEHTDVGKFIVDGVFPEALVQYDRDVWANSLHDLGDVPIFHQFDVISLFHVLEHVPDPVAFLQAIWDRLEDNGIFIFEYPDILRATDRDMIMWQYFQRSHLFDFSYHSIAPLLESIGFTLESLVTFGNGFPNDKNVLLVLRKGEPKEPDWQSGVSESLLERIRGKLQRFYISKKPRIRFLHIASHHINVGDGAIISGIRDFFRGATDVDIDVVEADIVDMRTPGDIYTAEVIHDTKADLVLVGGGGTIDGHYNRVHTGTALNMPLEEMEKLKIPMAFCGLGHNVFLDQEFYQIHKLQQLLNLCAAKGWPFSVRRDGSLERMSQFLDVEHVVKVPDPGYFVRPFADYETGVFQPRGERKSAIFQITADGYSNRFGGKEETIEYIEEVSRVIEWLITDQNYAVTLALHTTDDLVPAQVIHGTLSRGNARYFLRTTAANMHPSFARIFFTSYSQADLVVGMRGHSIICAAGLRTPFVALSTHNKISGFLDEIGCAEYGVDNGLDLAERLQHAVLGVIIDPQKQLELIDRNTAYWAKELNDFAYRCLELV